MKKQYMLIALGAMLMASCADEFERNFEAQRPDRNPEDYAYLADYAPLKDYVTNSNFKLGVGTDAADYAKQGVSYVVTNANFTETVAGNAMKMGSVIDDKGEMNFATVESYVREATLAGLNVYGHTLAWHEQQPVKWLNTLIADRIPEGGADESREVINMDFENDQTMNGWGLGHTRDIKEGSHDGSKYMEITMTSAGASWEAQAAIDFSPELEEGQEVTLHFWAKSSSPYRLTANFQNPNGYAGGGDFMPAAELTGEWQEFTSTAIITNVGNVTRFLFNYGDFVGTICIDDLWVGIPEKELEPYWDNVIENSDMEGSSNVSFYTKVNNGNPEPSEILDGVGKNGSRGIKVMATEKVYEAWDNQFWFYFTEPVAAGTKYKVSFDYKADNAASIATQAHAGPGDYNDWQMFGNVNFTTDWQTFTYEGVVSAAQAPDSKPDMFRSVAFNLNDYAPANNYYFDNIVFEIEKMPTGGGIPLTDEEKKDTLMWAMEQWVAGMMKACKDEEETALVKAWDVVNEAIDGWGTPDGEGILPLQHGTESDADRFFWQDYLGDEDYVRTVVRLARQYGGNDLTLFINDYGLEGYTSGEAPYRYLERPQKVESLIKWITRWEKDNVTKIDGIGTQMHINCFENPADYEALLKGIEDSFTKMAATGKLVRVSELDMGYIDADGNKVLTADMTEEQHHKMAELYKAVIQMYMKVIPESQQWGITQWCPTDAPAGTGWRAGEPVGLWDLNYNRKHTYAGFADGLAGK